MEAFARRFFGAVEAGDTETVASLYHDDVKIWHNYDDVEQSKAENLATLGSIQDRYDAFGYAQARHTDLEGGFLRQHTIEVSRGGSHAAVPAILRVYVRGERISRIEEYFDRRSIDALFATETA